MRKKERQRPGGSQLQKVTERVTGEEMSEDEKSDFSLRMKMRRFWCQKDRQKQVERKLKEKT